MKPGTSPHDTHPAGTGSNQPPPSQQENSSARPTEVAPTDEAPSDSASAAERAMKQTSKTQPESDTGSSSAADKN